MLVLAAALRSLAKTFQTPRHFFSIVPAIERRGSKIAFALRTETATGRDDHVYVTEHTIEHFPTRLTIRSFYPKVRSVHAAKSLHPGHGVSCKQYNHGASFNNVSIIQFFE